jgi:hypothetical protein
VTIDPAGAGNDEAYWVEVRRAVGRGAPSLLFGTSTRALRRSLTRLRETRTANDRSPMNLTMTEHDFSLLVQNTAKWADEAAAWQQRIEEGSFENYTIGEDVSRRPSLGWERAYWFRSYDSVVLAKSFLASQDDWTFCVLADLRDGTDDWIILTNYITGKTDD